MSELTKRDTTSVVTSLKDKISNIRKNIDTCILADVSGSMDEPISPNERKIDALKSCLQDFKHIKLYEFSTNCHTVIELSSPNGSTALHRAFEVVKLDNIKKVILLTDGWPDNPALAL